MFLYVVFCQHLAGMATEADRIQKLVAEIGERLKELRDARGETLRQVADRVSCGYDYISKIERGLENPTIDLLAELIIVGLHTNFETFCRPWFTDRERDKQERHARTLLERLLLRGKDTRVDVIEALKLVAGGIEKKPS
jgi:transcriptional regulator with XRE-family HTH domain